KLPAGDPLRKQLEAKERELLKRYTGQWLEVALQRFLAEEPLDDPFDRERRKFAEEQNALPLLEDMGGCLALRVDGQVLSFVWDAPDQPRLETDVRIRNTVMYQRARTYPQMRLMIPPRPVSSRECSHCRGTGICSTIPGIVCYCGGLG